MKTTSKVKSAGLVLGLSLIVASNPVVLAAGNNPSDASLKAGAIDPAVIAPAEQLGKAFTMVADHVKPAVVSVYSEKNVTLSQPEFSFPFGNDFMRQFFGRQLPQIPQQHDYQGRQRGMGSGMILNKEGFILTNYHVVRDVDDIKVQLADRRTLEAEIVGTDPQTDVAIIRIKGSVPDDLPTVTLGDSDASRVGELVLAIGAPFGFAQTVTSGIISATGRSDVGMADYEDYLQTDAPINPGNSGGPLVNMRGEVIGMNSAIATNDGQFAGIGFSIPSNMIKSMLAKLTKGEKIVRGQLGVMIQEMNADLAKQFGMSEPNGVLVSQVEKDSAAEKAGLKVGDIVVRYDGTETNSVKQLHNLVANTPPGEEVKIEILRSGKEQTLTAAIGRQTAQFSGATPSAEVASVLSKLGLTVQTLSSDLAKQLGVNADRGAAVTDVGESSLAALAGLQRGDVIVEADHQPVSDVNQLEQILAGASGKSQVLLRVARQGGSMFIVLQTK